MTNKKFLCQFSIEVISSIILTPSYGPAAKKNTKSSYLKFHCFRLISSYHYANQFVSLHESVVTLSSPTPLLQFYRSSVSSPLRFIARFGAIFTTFHRFSTHRLHDYHLLTGILVPFLYITSYYLILPSPHQVEIFVSCF